MKLQETKKPQPDLKPYQPYGIPMLKLLAGLAAISLFLVLIYEYVF